MPTDVNHQNGSLPPDSVSGQNGFIFFKEIPPGKSADSTGLLLRDWNGLNKFTNVYEGGGIDTTTNQTLHTAHFRKSVLSKKTSGHFPETLPHQPTDNTWLSVFFTLALAAAGSSRYYNGRSFTLLLKSTFSSLSPYDLLRERQHFTGVLFTAPFLLSSFLFAITITYILRESGINLFQTGVGLLLIFPAIILIQVIKHGLIKLLGYLFETQKEADMHVLFHHQFFCLSGWFFLPLLGFTLFSPVNNMLFFHIIIIATISFSVIYTTLRLIVNYSYKGLTYTGLFILYICSTELLPVLTVIKLIYLQGNFLKSVLNL